MAPRPIEQYSIHAGYNTALVSLVNIETIKPTNDSYYFVLPMGYGHHISGVPRTRLDKLSVYNGYESVKWKMSAMTRLQYEYLITTYCTVGLSGPVTIYTTLGTSTYVRCNAVINVDDTEGTDGETYAFKDFSIRFTGITRL